MPEDGRVQLALFTPLTLFPHAKALPSRSRRAPDARQKASRWSQAKERTQMRLLGGENRL